MNRLLIIIMSMGLLFLSGCSSRTGDPAGITDANALGGRDYHGGVQTYALGKNDNLSGEDSGPSKGLLGKRSYYFDYQSGLVRSNDYSAIEEHGQYLADHPKAKILLEGNTDIRGSREWNIALGYNRAKSVSAILFQQGARQNQVRIVSYGPEKPASLGQTEEDYQLNRRVDVIYEAD